MKIIALMQVKLFCMYLLVNSPQRLHSFKSFKRLLTYAAAGASADNVKQSQAHVQA